MSRGSFCECESSSATASDRVHRDLDAVSDTLKPGFVEQAYRAHDSRNSTINTVCNVAFKGKDQWLTTSRKLRIRKDSNSSWMQIRPPHTVPTYTVPTTVVTENFFRVGQMRGKTNTTYSVFAPQPVVKFAEGDAMQGRDWTPSLEVRFVRDDGTTRGVLSNMGDVVRQVWGPGEIVMRFDQAYQYFDPVWIPSPETGLSSLIGVFCYCQWTIDESLPATTVEPRSLKNLTDILEMRPEEKSNCTAMVSTVTASWNIS